MVTRLLSIRPIRCVECGDAERLVTVTLDAVMSRCYACGDTWFGPTRVAPPSNASGTAAARRRLRPTAAG
jgi:hypothetical protein